MNLLKLFKKPVTKRLPNYPFIKLADIPPASAILFYGGNNLTELIGNRLYNHPYKPPAFHAAFYICRGLFLNVGKFRTVQLLKDEFRSARRIDVVVFKDIPADKRNALCDAAVLDASVPRIGLELPDYAFTDYLRFGMRFLQPSKKDFCSENVAELFLTQGVKLSDLKPVDTAPWDIEEYAEAHPEACEIRTLWCGLDFKG